MDEVTYKHQAMEEVLASYKRCLLTGTFFDDFYKALLGMSPTIREKFIHTDMARQEEIIKTGVTYLLKYFCNPGPLTMQKIVDIGESHAQAQYDIPPYMYGYWVSALMATVANHDPLFSATLERNWQMVLDHGISAIKSLYI
ncbi:MAG: globin [Methylococcaceae bacterium]|nr:MAG: globin [Methylococcaceae bacterium]